MSNDNDFYEIGIDSTNRTTILVVDDESVIRDLLFRTLGREGFRVVTACDGVEALNCLKGSKIDIVISDIMMPRMNGLELLVEVKCDYPQIPVLLITGYAGNFSGKQALEAGAEDFIVKPFKNSEIRYAIQRTLVRLEKSK